jgi:hypothetical protein
MSSYRSTGNASWGVRFRKSLPLLAGTMGVLLLCLPLFSQGNFGRITGTVTDQSGGVVSNATVSVIDTERNVSRTLSTDDAGEYNAPNLIPSTYTVRAEAKGFKKIERVGVELGVGKEIRVDLIVQPGQQEQTVTVTESIPLVETTNATLGGTLNNADIVDMPLNGRNYQNLLSLRPGVMTQPGGSPWTQSTNNSRPDESVWMVDGVLNVNLYDYRPIASMPSPFTDGATILPVDAIQEFNLMENPKAEYGWRPGAVVNVGVKSGTNTLHGSAYGFYRSGNWDARNAFDPEFLLGTVPHDKLPTALKQFGGTVGGPIKKDRLFFFGGYEGLRSFVGNAIGTSVPATGALATGIDPGNSMTDALNCLSLATAAACGPGNAVPLNPIKLSPVSLDIFGCNATAPFTCTGGVIANAPANTTTYNSGFPNTNRSDNGVGKMDYRLNDKHSINGMVLIGNYFGNGEDHPVVNSYWQNGDPIRTVTVGADWVWTPNSRIVNDARFGYNRVNFALTNDDSSFISDGTGGLCTPTGCGGKGFPLNTGITSVTGFPTVTIAGFSPLGGWRGRPVEFTNPYYDIQDSVSYLAGKHSFKFGVEYTHIHADINLHDTRGRIDFVKGGISFKQTVPCKAGQTPPCTISSTALEDFFAGTPTRGSQLVGTTVRNLSWHNIAGFVQDDWRATSKLIINLGLRYSYVSPIRDDNNLLGSFDPTLGMVQQGQAGFNTLWGPDYKDFSPRVGFAWDLSGKGTTVIRGGVSRIYSMFTPAQFMQSPFQNFKNGTFAAVPTGGTCTVGDGIGCQGPLVGGPGTFGGTIGLGSASISRDNLCWDASSAATCKAGVGQVVVFPAGANVGCSSGAQCDLTTVSANLLTPFMTNWNLGITHAFTNNLSLEVSYVGNHGSNLTGFRDLNMIDPSDPREIACGHCEANADRPLAAAFPYLRYVNMTVNDARSNYHSMQATLTERASHGLSFTAGYTLGHGLDNGSLNRFGNLPQTSLNPGLEYGNSDFDIRHRLTVTATYDLPGVKGYAQLLEGWKLNTIVTIQGALPWIVDDNGNDFSANGADSADRWDFFGNPGDFGSGSTSIMHCTGPGAGGCFQTSGITGLASCGTLSGVCSAATSQALWNQCLAVAPDPTGTLLAGNGGCFVSGRSVMVPPALGTFGTMGRNMFRDSGFKNVDFSVFKTFTYKERYSAQFRAEIFNLFNHPIISNPYGAANGAQLGYDPSSGSTFGCGCATPDTIAGNPLVGSGSSRVIQVGLKLQF